MANDRLWIKCKECGERVLLLKYWGMGEAAAYKPTEVGEFVEQHVKCKDRSDFLDGDRCFDIVTDD